MAEEHHPRSARKGTDTVVLVASTILTLARPLGIFCLDRRRPLPQTGCYDRLSLRPPALSRASPELEDACAMTLREMTRRIAGDDYRIEGSDAGVNQLCVELKG